MNKLEQLKAELEALGETTWENMEQVVKLALEIKYEEERTGVVKGTPYGNGTVCRGFKVPSPQETGYAENMAYYYRLYYDPAVNNYRSWADVGRK